MEDLRINENVVIGAEHLTYTAARSSGPGGQNVNKVASKVDLRFDLAQSAMPPAVKARLRALSGVRIDRNGCVQIICQDTRDQRQNLSKARQRLKEFVLRALERPKRRKATKPSRGAKRRRLEGKRQNSEKKAQRRKVDH